ncbi:FCSD flavin-binding domain-containing protein [Fretibacter rubidus]|uniref:FCSD flavin-binding domain-containing protein n=1 Tax=Fretibacter rubidus TaxID=570162 RepID=UPI00352B4D32
MSLSRRHIIAGLAALPLMPSPLLAKTKARVVIIGGGFGGASAAQMLRDVTPNIEVTLIEPKDRYIACPFSNLVVSGERDITAQHFHYDGLRARGITVIQDKATDIDPVKQTVRLSNAQHSVPYDRLIMSPGINMRWGAIEGYNEAAATHMPHGWTAGQQSQFLAAQLQAMENGGICVISVPRAPYRCPPGPYERASLIAYYLKTQKPRSKLIILDAKNSFSKQALFEQAWAEHYGDLIEWRGSADDGIVSRVDADTRAVFTDFETIKADVANIIPPQMAGSIAAKSGVTDSTGWCPIDATSFESRLQDNIHVIGDAAIATPMPKSAFAANLQGKLCAIAVARLLSGLATEPTTLTNTCYSYVTPDTAVSITGVYQNNDGQFTQVQGAGGTSALDNPRTSRKAEAIQAADWFTAITQDAFG